MRGRNDLADKEDVVSGGMQRIVPTFQPCRTAFDQGRSRGAEAKRDTGEAIDVRPREASCQTDLVVGEHVDGVLAGTGKYRQTARASG